MDKEENKGLADNQDGEFVLNESGTSVTVDSEKTFQEDKDGIDAETNVKLPKQPREVEDCKK